MSTLNLATVDKLTSTNLNTTNLIVEENFSFKRMSGANFLSPVTQSVSTLETNVNTQINNMNTKVDNTKETLENQMGTLTDRINAMQSLPTPGTQDNGKFLIVVNGVPTWTEVTDAEGVAF